MEPQHHLRAARTSGIDCDYVKRRVRPDGRRARPRGHASDRLPPAARSWQPPPAARLAVPALPLSSGCGYTDRPSRPATIVRVRTRAGRISPDGRPVATLRTGTRTDSFAP